MQQIVPDIVNLLPSTTIDITPETGKTRGVSDSYQLIVSLQLVGDLPSTAVVTLDIHNANLYRFENGKAEKEFLIVMTQQTMRVQLPIRIMNLFFNPTGNQDPVQMACIAHEQASGPGFPRADFQQIAVAIHVPHKMNFKSFH